MLYKGMTLDISPPKTALITGITGQDGATLAEILLKRGDHVHGLRPYSATPDLENLAPLLEQYEGRITLHYGDVLDGANITRLIDKIAPHEVYNLAGMSHVRVSFDMAEMTAQVNALGALRILEALRQLDAGHEVKFYQASSSEMFGRSQAPQNEQTPFEPCSPYGTAKLYAYWSVRNYRDAYGLFACNGILFNHESALRGQEFVTRKITKAIGEIEAGTRQNLTLGNLDSVRDWGHAHDYMRGATLMMAHDTPDDFILASGEGYSVRDFVARAFKVIDIDITWRGQGIDEVGINAKTGETLITIDPELFRPNEINTLIGDATKARDTLGWKPEISFDALVTEMVQQDRLVTRSYKKSLEA